MRTIGFAVGLLLGWLGASMVLGQTPIGTVFTYQGQLMDGGTPANDNYDFVFNLYATAGGGDPLASDTADDWPVAEGYFTVWLDFGADAFNGQQRWIEVGVRPWGSGGAYTILTPRQEVTAAPYGLYALTAATATNADTVDGSHANATPTANTLLPLDASTKFPNSVLMTGVGNGLDADLLDAQQGSFYQNATNLIAGTLPDARLAGTYSSALTFSNATNSFTGSGSGLTNLNASNLATGTVADARLSSNVALLNNTQTFTGAKTFSTGPSFTAAGAPFSVTSSTVVTNLNADLLDAQHGSFYQNASNINAGTLADGRLSSNVALLDNTQTFTGSKTFSAAPGFTAAGAPFTVSSTTKVTNLNADWLDGYNSGNASGQIPVSNGTVCTNLNADLLDGQTGSFYQNAGNINAGTLADARLSSNVALLNAVQTFSANKFFSADVGIGVGVTSYPLTVFNTTDGFGERAIYGVANTTGTAAQLWGVKGQTQSTATTDAGAGVLGQASATTGASDGVRGESACPSGSGVFGWATSSSGTNYGGRFLTGSSAGRAVNAQATAASGSTYAGYFEIASPAGRCVYAINNGAGNYNTPAVYGQHGATDGWGIGVQGVGGFAGVEGEVSPTGTWDYFGVHGSVSGGSGSNYGVCGNASGSTANNFGVYGVAGDTGNMSYGGFFFGGQSYGVGVYAAGGSLGKAGYFNGNVTVTGTLSKGGGTFTIDHPLDPENKYLQHSFVESPDMMNVYNGNVVTDEHGYASVTLPEWFEVLNRDFRYQLTVVDEDNSDEFVLAKVVRKIEDNQFVIRTSVPHVEVSWQVTGIRQDPFANANRVQVELDKRPDERGLYLHPEAWSQPEEKGIGYAERQQVRRDHQLEK